VRPQQAGIIQSDFLSVAGYW